MEQPGSVSQPVTSATITSGGITVESNTGTQESLQAELSSLDAAIETHKTGKPAPTPEPPDSETATDLPPAATVETAKPKVGRPRNDPQARIDEITAKHREAERRADQAERELAALRAPKIETPARPVATPDDPEPQATAFTGGEYDPAFLRASAKWEARQEFKAQQAEAQKVFARDRQISAVETRMAAFGARLASAVKDVPAFLETISPEIINLKTSDAQQLLEPGRPVEPGNAIADCVSDSDHPKALLQHLHDHPEVFQRLLTLHPINVIREMGRIEARLDAAPSGPARALVSQAKPPMKPVVGAPVVGDDPPGDDATDEEHVAYMNRKERESRRRRG